MCFPYLTYKFACLNFKILTFKFHMMACSISFDSHLWTQKSNIILASYEVFHLLTRSCVCIPHLWHKFAFSFIAYALTFIITFSRLYIIDGFVSFNFSIWTQKFDIIRATYELFSQITHSRVCFLIWRTSLLGQLLKSCFLDFIS